MHYDYATVRKHSPGGKRKKWWSQKRRNSAAKNRSEKYGDFPLRRDGSKTGRFFAAKFTSIFCFARVVTRSVRVVTKTAIYRRENFRIIYLFIYFRAIYHRELPNKKMGWSTSIVQIFQPGEKIILDPKNQPQTFHN